MKSYAAQQRKPADYLVAIIVAVLVMGGIVYALMSGAVGKLTHEQPPIKTEVIKEQPKPPPPPPPPPPPQMEQPPPPYIPPPKISVPPPPKAVQRVTQTKPPHPVPPSPTPTPVPTPAPPTPNPVPAVPDHSAGARPINGAKPEYPEEAQEENREGKVTASCDILPTGYTANCQIVSSSGGHEFVESALEFLRKAKYQPAVVNGAPVMEHHHILHVDFNLGD
ncbi:energy transducer TonB [Neokomagataea thailandica]|uniref:TonB periplasmic protein n=1 Tax=Neokomagataea tanensis NBRC 106556 TaxID=1223519 RepID=A0ABQ0QJ02_9PROT|nr:MULTISPECIES: energy transducer TonB [Neokomagataea]GBR46525.1 TonB periplasmic protein [Neokomagataea tanensis NBRC 106556]